MNTRALAAALIVATLAAASQPALAQQPQPGEGQLNSHALPIAAGALVGAAASFFLLPLIVPAMAVTATGVTVTASPVVAVVGAGVGGYLGYEITR